MAFNSPLPRSEHKECGGAIIEKYRSEQASEQFICLKCGKVWGVVSDLSDIEVPSYREQKRESSSVFYELENFNYVAANVPGPIINWLFNDRLRRVIKMVDFPSNINYVGLDVGCAHGYLTQYLAQRINGTVIGIDVDRNDLYRAKIRARLKARFDKSASGETIEYVRCNVNYLPFKRDSIDIVTSISVLEHINDLEGAIKEIRASMTKKGCLIAGYPMETKLFMAILKLFLPSGLSIRDPRIWGKEKFESAPETHKQSFKTIRGLLITYFSPVRREKSFFTILPDQISWYECIKVNKKN
jgi:ubiquinone/menaquinone biosynthesis C-methylase UbiE